MSDKTKIQFDALNKLRIENGKKPLKSWKESSAKLEAALIKERKLASPDVDSTPPAKEETAKSQATTVSLVEIAKDIGMDPKVARAKMRRIKDADDLCDDSGRRHTYPVSNREKIVAMLKRDNRKKS